MPEALWFIPVKKFFWTDELDIAFISTSSALSHVDPIICGPPHIVLFVSVPAWLCQKFHCHIKSNWMIDIVFKSFGRMDLLNVSLSLGDQTRFMVTYTFIHSFSVTTWSGTDSYPNWLSSSQGRKYLLVLEDLFFYKYLRGMTSDLLYIVLIPSFKCITCVFMWKSFFFLTLLCLSQRTEALLNI